DALERGLARALEAHGGVANARNMYADYDESYDFTVTVGDASWYLAPLLTEKGFRSRETFMVNGREAISRESGADQARINGVDQPAMDALAPAYGMAGRTTRYTHCSNEVFRSSCRGIVYTVRTTSKA